MFLGFTIGFLVALGIILKTFIVVPERSKVIKERLGNDQVLGAGFHFLIPFVDRAAYRQEVREQVIGVPSQSCITRDNIQVDVDGFVYLKVTDARKASYGIGNYITASVNLAQTTMRSEIGKLTLDETFTERDAINENIVNEIDKASAPWGIKMIRYEIMNIDPSVALWIPWKNKWKPNDKSVRTSPFPPGKKRQLTCPKAKKFKPSTCPKAKNNAASTSPTVRLVNSDLGHRIRRSGQPGGQRHQWSRWPTSGSSPTGGTIH